MSEQQQSRAVATTRQGNKRQHLKQSATFASTTFVSLGLIDVLAHLGPTGLLLAGLGSYVAWKHGPEVFGSITEQIREVLPQSEEEGDEAGEETEQQSDDPNKRGFWERAFNLPQGDDDQEATLKTKLQADDYEITDYEEEDDECSISEGATFHELLQLGVIQKALKKGLMVLGFENGELRYGTWEDFNSAGIGGVSRSGKTTTVRFLLFQTVLMGGRFIMIDPHIADIEESLAAQFRVFGKRHHVFEPSDGNASALTKRVRWLMKEYLRRKEQGIKGPPIILVMDELNGLLRRLAPELRKELVDLLLTIAQEGGKFGLFTLLIAQRWSEQDLGGKPWGAAIRSSLSSMLAHRFIDEEQAKKLIGSKNGPRCLDLEKGHYFFRDTDGHLTEMVTPFTREEDSRVICRLAGIRAEPVKVAPVQVEDRQALAQQETVPVNNVADQDRPSGIIRSPYYDQTIYNDGNPNRSVGNQNRPVNLGVNTPVNGSESDESPYEEERDLHLRTTSVNAQNGGRDTHTGPVNVNVNGAQGVSADKRETIKRAVDMGILTHAQIAKMVKLDGRNYHIYKQVCAEEGIEIK